MKILAIFLLLFISFFACMIVDYIKHQNNNHKDFGDISVDDCEPVCPVCWLKVGQFIVKIGIACGSL